jgi:hypothetical protein
LPESKIVVWNKSTTSFGAAKREELQVCIAFEPLELSLGDLP